VARIVACARATANAGANCGAAQAGSFLWQIKATNQPPQQNAFSLNAAAARWTAATEPGDSMSPAHQDNEPVPWMQQLLDNPFLLLFLGVMVPMVVYTLWGVIDILTVPLAK
jgi:hypothetical protein